jgi:hypothetical protein
MESRGGAVSASSGFDASHASARRSVVTLIECFLDIWPVLRYERVASGYCLGIIHPG